ncbi:IS607-like element IS1535 family transposase [Actinomadura vinacea]|uniref:IS607-like element IS1535 family transposase n=1 Tax=Actinomadura vinacea TaxID=115336 RepID=A0ABN3IFJ0_9ACTN
MNLTDWARAQGIAPRTAYRWFREGTLPVPAERVGPRTILVNIDANTSPPVIGGVGLYARVSSRDQKADLERQIARLSEWAAKAGHTVIRVESEIASGMDGGRTTARRLLADSKVTAVAVENKDRLGRMNVELIEAALSASGRRLVVLDEAEVDDDVDHDLERDMVEALTWFCARLYGRGSAKSRAHRALEAAAADE